MTSVGIGAVVLKGISKKKLEAPLVNEWVALKVKKNITR